VTGAFLLLTVMAFSGSSLQKDVPVNENIIF
jgi:hypothetical protein